MVGSPNGRSWSDDDLRAAVAAQHSWRGTARALGLRGSSAGTIRSLKRRARELQLDTAHFTGQRTWSDRQLTDAIAVAASWADVLSHLGLTDNAGARLRVRGHAARLGLDVAPLSPRVIEGSVPGRLCADRALLRCGAEQFASAWFSVRGAAVAKPEHPAAYDLLASFGGGHHRVQVKTTTSRGPHGTWAVNIGRRPYALDKSASRQPYDPDELDYFFIIDGDLNVYLVPSQVVAGKTAINVSAYRQFCVGDASSLFEAPAPFA